MHPFESLSLERPQWIDGLGYDVFPLNRLADRLQVSACGEEPLEPGEVVIVRQSDGRYAARIVKAGAPLVLSPLFSSAEDRESRPIGRVLRLARAGRTIALPALRLLLAPAHRLGAQVREHPVRRSLTQKLQLLPYSPPAVALRRALFGPFTVRRIVADDAEQVRRLADAELPAMTEFLVRQTRGRWVHAGVPVGAFTRTGRLVGMFYADGYREEGIDIDGIWIRALIVARAARGLGLTRALTRAAFAERARLGPDLTHVYADVSAANRLVVEALLPTYGGRPAPEAVTARLNAEFVRRGLGDGWSVYELPVEAVRRAVS